MINDMSKKAVLGDEFCFVLDFSTCQFYPVKYIAGNFMPERLPYNISKRDIFNLYCSYYHYSCGIFPWAVTAFNNSKVDFYHFCTRRELIMLLYSEILTDFDLLKLGFDDKVGKVFIYTNTLNLATADDFKFCIELR